MASLSKRRRGGPDASPLWQLRVRIAGRDRYRFVHGSVAEADAALAAFAAELEERGAPVASPATPFAVWAEGWLARQAPALAARSVAGYRALLDRHLLPAIGARRLNRIAAADGLALQAALLGAGLAPSSVSQVLRLGRVILADAQRLRVLAASPWAEIRQPQRARAPRMVLDPARFQPTAAAGGALGDLLALALATGLRRSELLALRWQDLQLDAGRLAVTGALEQVGAVIRRKGPKTAAGYRQLALPGTAIGMLRARRLEAAEAALAAGRSLDTLPVFPGPDGQSWANPDSVSQAGRRALRRAGCADSLHGLRHAHATALLSGGVNPAAVAARLGHADPRTTLEVYGHALPRDEAAAIGVLERALG